MCRIFQNCPRKMEDIPQCMIEYIYIHKNAGRFFAFLAGLVQCDVLSLATRAEAAI